MSLRIKSKANLQLVKLSWVSWSNMNPDWEALTGKYKSSSNRKYTQCSTEHYIHINSIQKMLLGANCHFENLWIEMTMHMPPSHQWFVCTLEDIANKVAAPSFHSLSANEAEVIHVTNTLRRYELQLLKSHKDIQRQFRQYVESQCFVPVSRMRFLWNFSLWQLS